MSDNKQLTRKPDNRPTTAEWPVKVWSREEIPDLFKAEALKWIETDFESLFMVYSPQRRSSANSFPYLFGYGKGEEIFYSRKTPNGAESKVILRSEIQKIETRRELLNAEIHIFYAAKNESGELVLPYVPSTYYLYDPFLNWMLGLDRDFIPVLSEREHPRPEKLYHESLTMYNFSLNAYRLGDGFEDYEYRFEKRRKKWMPWKIMREEWLKVQLERGTYQQHTFGYLTECIYENLQLSC